MLTTNTISKVRREELVQATRKVMTDLPTIVKGHQTMAQEILNRIESITKKSDEYKFLVDLVCWLCQDSKGKEMRVTYMGKTITKEQLFRDHGLLVSPKKDFFDPAKL